MEYDNLLLDLLNRVIDLENRVDALEKKECAPKEKPPRGTYTEMVKDYIFKEINKARKSGQSKIRLISREVQKEVGLKGRLPLVCNAMRACMDEKSKIINETASGQSSTFEIEWNLEN